MGSLAGYKIIKKIGHGSTCAVYLGEDYTGMLLPGEKVAVKIMKGRMSNETLKEIEILT